MKVTMMAILIAVLGTISKGLVRGLDELEIKGRTEPILITAQNTEMSPVELRRVAVTQTPVITIS